MGSFGLGVRLPRLNLHHRRSGLQCDRRAGQVRGGNPDLLPSRYAEGDARRGRHLGCPHGLLASQHPHHGAREVGCRERHMRVNGEPARPVDDDRHAIGVQGEQVPRVARRDEVAPGRVELDVVVVALVGDGLPRDGPERRQRAPGYPHRQMTPHARHCRDEGRPVGDIHAEAAGVGWPGDDVGALGGGADRVTRARRGIHRRRGAPQLEPAVTVIRGENDRHPRVGHGVRDQQRPARTSEPLLCRVRQGRAASVDEVGGSDDETRRAGIVDPPNAVGGLVGAEHDTLGEGVDGGGLHGGGDGLPGRAAIPRDLDALIPRRVAEADPDGVPVRVNGRAVDVPRAGAVLRPVVVDFGPRRAVVGALVDRLFRRPVRRN